MRHDCESDRHTQSNRIERRARVQGADKDRCLHLPECDIEMPVLSLSPSLARKENELWIP